MSIWLITGVKTGFVNNLIENYLNKIIIMVKGGRGLGGNGSTFPSPTCRGPGLRFICTEGSGRCDST